MIQPVFEKSYSPAVLALRKERLGKENQIPEDPRRIVMGLYKDQILLSFVTALEQDPESYQIEEIAVQKALEKRKIGTNALLFLEVRVRERGGRRLYAEVPLPLRPFFERNGFHPLGMGELLERKGAYYLPMEKWLVNPFRKRRPPKRDGRL